MAIKKIRCHCAGKPSCGLCGGKGRYDYEPGPMGFMPFVCPTCSGQRELRDDDGAVYRCLTCKGLGSVDPANPPPGGMFDVLMKVFFGA